MQKIRQDISIGDNIRRLRNRAGLTQEATIAQLQVLGCGLSRSAYSQIEMGEYNIRVSELAAMKRVFKAGSYDEFFQGIAEHR